MILVAVAAALVVPGVMLAAGFKPRAIENRPLYVMPALSGNGLLDDSWFKAVDAFLSDNVAVRPLAIKLRGEAFYRTGGTGTTDVLRGKGDWLFPTNAFAPTCRHTADDIAAALRVHAAAFASAGVMFRFLVVPDKQTIYPEEVGNDPFPPACSEVGRATLRSAIAALGVDGIDAWTVEAAARTAEPTTQLWYHGDTHWTSAGAQPVIAALVGSLPTSPWDASEVAMDVASSHSDDLATSMGISRVETLPKVTGRAGVKVATTNVAVGVTLHNAPSVFTTTASGRPTVAGRTLILYDSAFNEQQALVAPWFANATWVHVGDMQTYPQLATQLGPFNTVIVERVERFLYGDDIDALLRGFQPTP